LPTQSFLCSCIRS